MRGVLFVVACVTCRVIGVLLAGSLASSAEAVFLLAFTAGGFLYIALVSFRTFILRGSQASPSPIPRVTAR